MSLFVVVHLKFKNLNYLRPRLSFLFCICTVPGIMRSQSINSTSEVRILKQLLILIKNSYLLLSLFFAYPAKNWHKSVPLRTKRLLCCLWYFRRKMGKETYQTLTHQCSALFMALFYWWNRHRSLQHKETASFRISYYFHITLKIGVGKGIMMLICASFLANPFLHVYPYLPHILKLAWQQFKAFQLREEQCRWKFFFSIHVMQNQRFSCFWPVC